MLVKVCSHDIDNYPLSKNPFHTYFQCVFLQDATQIGEVNTKFTFPVTISASSVQRTNLGISRRTKLTSARLTGIPGLVMVELSGAPCVAQEIPEKT